MQNTLQEVFWIFKCHLINPEKAYCMHSKIHPRKFHKSKDLSRLQALAGRQEGKDASISSLNSYSYTPKT